MMDTRNPTSTHRSHWRLEGALPVMAEQCQARGTRAGVAAAAPNAALIAAEMLRDGGNAYDAAVAACLAETVLLPPKCGLSGDLIALCWAPHSDRPEALLAIGGAPDGLAGLTARGELKPTGPTSVGVPGAPAGYLALASRGRLPLDRLAAPAMALADSGFCWSRICTALAAESADLVAEHNPGGSIYFPDGKPIEPGARVRLPGLARALAAFVRDREHFLAGEVGEAIRARVNAAGGALSRNDFAEYSAARWTTCTAATLGDRPFFVTPAPTHGPVLHRALAQLPESPATAAAKIHAATMQAIDWRKRELAEPSGTSMVSAIDADGVMVTVVHSNSYPRFGSGLIADDFDLILANRAGRGFSSDPAHPNFPRAGRRPATTLHAWAVSVAPGVRLQGATPGGANQVTWNAQTLARVAAGETDIGRLIAAPRWEWLPADDALRIEAGFSDAELESLAQSAPRLEAVGRWGTASAMQLLLADAGRGSIATAADPRTVGSALAW